MSRGLQDHPPSRVVLVLAEGAAFRASVIRAEHHLLPALPVENVIGDRDLPVSASAGFGVDDGLMSHRSGAGHHCCVSHEVSPVRDGTPTIAPWYDRPQVATVDKALSS